MCRIVFILMLAFLVSCSSSDKTLPYAFRIYEDDGVTIAETSGGPKYEGELFTYEPLVSMKEDEREESLLYRPSQFTMDEEGWFYVYDSGDHCLVVYDPTGRFSHRFGREGQGPGEFRYPRIQCVENGIITLWDPSLRRVTRFSTDGVFQDVYTVKISRGYTLSGFYYISEDRQLLLSSNYDMNSREGPINSAGATVIDASGDTIWTVETPKINTGYMANMKLGDREYEIPMPYPYSPYPYACYYCGLGIVLGGDWKPELEIFDLDGTLKRRVRIAMPPEPVSEEDRQSVNGYYERLVSEAEDRMKESMESQWKAIRFSKYKAPWMDAEVDDAGFIWLGMTEAYDYALRMKEGVRYRLLSPEGEYLGITRRPPGMTTKVRFGTLLANLTDQDTGEFKLTAYSMKPAVDGLKYP